MCQEANNKKTRSPMLEYTRQLSKQRAMSHKTYVTSNKNVEMPKMCNMKMEGMSAGVYGFMASILFSSLFFFLEPKDPTLCMRYHPCSVCVMMTTGCCQIHEFNPWKRSKHPLCSLPCPLNQTSNSLPIAQNAASQGDVCIWHHVLSGDQPEMNNRCP